MFNKLGGRFHDEFHSSPTIIVRAPGRVNLIGEHVDYNDGWVLPAAIDRAAYVAAAWRAEARVCVVALDLNESVTFDLSALEAKVDIAGQPLPRWALYPAGVAWALMRRGLAVAGLDAVLTANVPRGAGLSSSAAVEVALALTWQELGGWHLAPLDLARACQQAENEYVGVNCGLMDQFAAACGRAGHALLLDCRTLEWQAVPLPEDVAVVVADTGVRRELAGSEYNIRRAQCAEAVRLLAEHLPGITALRDVSPADFERLAPTLPLVIARRARHVVEECARTLAAAEALRAGRLAELGALMNAGHASLRNLYEVSCAELDALAEAAQALPGCYGARLTGAGFGGCVISLVAAEGVTEFRQRLTAAYSQTTGQVPAISVCRPAAGAEVLSSDFCIQEP